ncbi:MAG: MarC family protein [Candidatus Woesearchaeota archaeon]
MTEAIFTATILSIFIASFSALFTIMNPISTASIYLTITKNNTLKEKRKIAKKAAIAAFIVLLSFALAGNLILIFFGITVDAFRIAGGLLITKVGFGMLSSKNDGREQITEEKDMEKEAIQKEDVSLVPLAIPMLSGPGAMTTAIVLMNETGGWKATSIWYVIALIAAILTVCIVSYIILRQSVVVQKYIGKNEQAVIDKIMGLIVLVVGIQFIINGIIGIINML